MIFSLPKILIFTDKIVLRQKLAQCPINFHPTKTKLLDKTNVGKNIIEINIIPVKKIIENNKFLNIVD